ncbi:MAG: hypothetical protein WCA37_04235, partial [Terracidiphilus sp.]
MHPKLQSFAVIAIAAAVTFGADLQNPAIAHAQKASQSKPATTRAAQSSDIPPADNPVADPNAIVTLGNARFTVLTPQLIRMEWAA